MKHIVANLVSEALQTLPELAAAAADLSIETTVERTRDASHGDFASNIAMRLAKPARKNPREIAASIVEALGENEQVLKVDTRVPTHRARCCGRKTNVPVTGVRIGFVELNAS